MTDRGIRSVHSNQRFFIGLRPVMGVADVPADADAGAGGGARGWSDKRRAPERGHERPPEAEW